MFAVASRACAPPDRTRRQTGKKRPVALRWAILRVRSLSNPAASISERDPSRVFGVRNGVKLGRYYYSRVDVALTKRIISRDAC